MSDEVKKEVSKEDKDIKKDTFPYTPTGSAVVKRFAKVFDEELGRDIVKEADDFNIVEFIQASASQTDIAMLKEQMIRTGQIPQVDATLEWGQDMTNMPTDIHDLYGVVKSVNDRFLALPENVRAIFDNNPDTFLGALMDGSYTSKVVNGLDAAAKAAAAAAEKKGE